MKIEKQSNSILKELPDWYLTPNDFYRYMTEENQYLNGGICELDKLITGLITLVSNQR